MVKKNQVQKVMSPKAKPKQDDLQEEKPKVMAENVKSPGMMNLLKDILERLQKLETSQAERVSGEDKMSVGSKSLE